MASVEYKDNGSIKITVSSGYDSKGKQIRHRMVIPADDLMGLTEKQKQKEIERQKVLFEQKVKNAKMLNNTQKCFIEFLQISGYDTTFIEAQQLQELMANTQNYIESRIMNERR